MEQEQYPINQSYNYCLEDLFTFEDLDNRRLLLNGDIDDSIIESVLYHILRYNRIDAKEGKKPEDRTPIIIYINSLGGEVESGLGVLDAILLSQTPVYTVNIGCAKSMACLIYMAGHKRYSLPKSSFLLHEGVAEYSGHLYKVADRIRFDINQMETIIEDFILSHSSISKTTYKNNIRNEWYFLPEDGKSLGIVDYIVGKDCSIDEIL